jgi:hypothetical protein
MEAFKRTISLTTSSVGTRVRVEIEVSVHPLQRVAPELTIDLQPLPADAMELSITASIYRGRSSEPCAAGQCRDDVRMLLNADPMRAEIAELCEIWKRWHLGGMNAGTRTQRDALADMEPAVYPESHYDKACTHLASKGLLVDRGYKFGSAWLSEPLPTEIAADVVTILDNLQKSLAHAAITAARARRLPKFKEHRTTLLDGLAAEGWRLSDRKLKVAHATSPDGSIRLWFKAQAVHCSVALGLQNHTLQIAHSLVSDIREWTARDLIERSQVRATASRQVTP